MRTILFILQKEFIQIFRNKTMLPMILVIPIAQLFVLTYAVTFEMKQIRFCVFDSDKSSMSRFMSAKFEGSNFFTKISDVNSIAEIDDVLMKNEADIAIVIPSKFEQNTIKEGSAKVQLLINAINANVAALSNAYSMNVIADFNSNIITEYIGINKGGGLKNIQTTHSYWYNPELNYNIFMAPGILVMLITTVGLFLSGMNIVREKEIGTIEQINVTPIKIIHFIIGKLLPFMIIGIFDLAIGLIVAKYWFEVPMLGSLWIIFLFAIVYLFALLGLGLLVSTITHTQQQALLFTWFFLVVFILMSGLFTPIESMPRWAQIIDYLNPLTYFIRVMRMVLLKGSNFAQVLNEFLMLGAYGLLIFAYSLSRYKKTT